MEMLGGGEGVKDQCRRPEIMSDSAYAILCRDHMKHTGYFHIVSITCYIFGGIVLILL